MPVVYVTTGAWGAGSGTPNSAAQVDGNFYTHEQAITALSDALDAGKSIDSVSYTANSFTLHFSDSSTQVIPLPIAELMYVGAWANGIPLFRGNLFSVNGSGIYQTLEDHTTPALPAVFDPDATTDDTDADPLYVLFLPLPGADGTLQGLSDVNVTEGSGINGYFLKWNNATEKWVASTVPLSGLSDVNVTEGSGINGYFLQWNNSTSKWVAAASSSNLAGLSDVNVTEGSGINGYFLQWDNATGKWIAAASSSALSGLSDVNVTEGSGINGYFLKWNNSTSKWVASTIPLSGMSDVNVTEGSGIDGYFLKWDNGTSKWVASLTGATAVSLSGLSDVNVTEGAGIDGYFLKWNNGTSKWVASAGLVAANNLSDLANAGTARTNLGLGGAAVLSVGTSAGTVAAGDDSRITGAAPLASPTFTGSPAAPTPSVGDNDTSIATTAFVTTAVSKGPVEWAVACSDETTALTTGTAKITFRIPFAMTVTAVRASLVTAQASGSIFTVDINESGTSIISTKLTIDNTEKTSTTAATPAVISDSSLADDAEITIDIDQIGDGTAKGLKVVLIGTRT